MSDLKPCPLCGGEAKTAIRGSRRLEAAVWCPECSVKAFVFPVIDRAFLGVRIAMHQVTKAWNEQQTLVGGDDGI